MAVVRRELDALAGLRYRTGLTAGERVRYRQLCANEQIMLNSTRP